MTRKRQLNLLDPSLLERIGAAAVKVDTARREVLRLKKERNALKCERVGTATLPPYWDQSLDGARPRTEWCPTCTHRDLLHFQVLKAVKRRRSLQRSLQRLCCGKVVPT